MWWEEQTVTNGERDGRELKQRTRGSRKPNQRIKETDRGEKDCIKLEGGVVNWGRESECVGIVTNRKPVLFNQILTDNLLY